MSRMNSYGEFINRWDEPDPDDEPTGGPYSPIPPFCMLTWPGEGDKDVPCYNAATWTATWKEDERIQWLVCDQHKEHQAEHPDPYIDVTWRKISDEG